MEEIIRIIESGEREAAVSAFTALTHDQQLDLLGKLQNAKKETVGAFLSSALERATEKDIQKTIKKLLFRLKTRGIRVEEPKMAGESVLRRVDAAREQTAFLSNFDPEGMRVVLLALEMKKKQFMFMHAVSQFSRGLTELAVVPASKEELGAILKDYLWRTQRPMVLPQISPAYAGYLIDEASGLSGKYATELRDLRPLMAGLKGDVHTPDDVCTLPIPQETRPKSVEEILTDPLFEPLALTWDGIEEHKKEFEAAVNPSIVLPPYVVEERRQGFLKKFIEDEKMKPTARLLKRLLEDYAYLFYVLGELESFRGMVERLPDEQFLRDALLHFVKKSFEKKEPEQQGVLVNPFEQQPPQPPSFPRPRYQK